MFSEMDTEHNDAIHDTGSYDMMKWKTNYFLLNGKIFTADLKNALSTVNDPTISEQKRAPASTPEVP